MRAEGSGDDGRVRCGCGALYSPADRNALPHTYQMCTTKALRPVGGPDGGQGPGEADVLDWRSTSALARDIECGGWTRPARWLGDVPMRRRAPSFSRRGGLRRSTRSARRASSRACDTSRDSGRGRASSRASLLAPRGDVNDPREVREAVELAVLGQRPDGGRPVAVAPRAAPSGGRVTLGEALQWLIVRAWRSWHRVFLAWRCIRPDDVMAEIAPAHGPPTEGPPFRLGRTLTNRADQRRTGRPSWRPSCRGW